jgi:hypothetical protein
MPEPFVKTLKRDYVYIHDRPNARTVLPKLSRWLEDCNENRPLKVLQFKSLQRFFALINNPQPVRFG